MFNFRDKAINLRAQTDNQVLISGTIKLRSLIKIRIKFK
ncbi:MAG: hypothetical protein JWQ14_3275 [Adhaeribacter sp.]|nr:hypothetical protein [Adhaeribacter sp.]